MNNLLVADTIRCIADYAQTGSMKAASKARASIRELAATDISLATPLWTITLQLQRHNMDNQ